MKWPPSFSVQASSKSFPKMTGKRVLKEMEQRQELIKINVRGYESRDTYSKKKKKRGTQEIKILIFKLEAH